MRVAVCLSGQPRTLQYCYKSLLRYFEGADFFCHAWNYNDYKVKNDSTEGKIDWRRENMTIEEVEDNIALFSPKNFLVETVDALGTERFPWDSMMYSALIANNLKKNWEIEHNFSYDIVIKARYDIVFNPTRTFKLNERINHPNYPHLYWKNHDLFTAHDGRMTMEFLKINISDVMMYGSSPAMDIVSDLYWHIKRESQNKKYDAKLLGPGTWMSDYICTNNLRFYPDPDNLREVVFRTSAIGLDVEIDWEKIVDHNNNIYK